MWNNGVSTLMTHSQNRIEDGIVFLHIQFRPSINNESLVVRCRITITSHEKFSGRPLYRCLDCLGDFDVRWSLQALVGTGVGSRNLHLKPARHTAPVFYVSPMT